MKRNIAFCLCLGLLLSLLAGCAGGAAYVPTGDGLDQNTVATRPSQGPVQAQTLTLGFDPDSSMNPYTATDLSNRLLLSLMYQPLFSVDRQYQVHPILCKNYVVSRDMRTYTFYLEQATFADGTVITAEDVVKSLRAAQRSPVYGGRLGKVSEIRATQDGAVQIVMSIPFENLPMLLDIPIVRGSQVNDAHPQGTGPYVWEESLSGPRLLRRGNWWCRAELAATAGSIVLMEVDGPTTLRDDFEFGNIGLVCTDPGLDTYVDYRCDYELWESENGIFLYLACNNKKGKVFSNGKLRAALTHAIDRSLLVTEHYRGFAKSATLPASPSSPWYDMALAEHYGYDPALFRTAVEEAGLTNTTVTLLVNKEDSRRVRAARAVAEMLTQAGLVVKLSILGGDSYTNALKKGNYDLHLGQTRLSANMDLSAFFDPKGALNFGGLGDAELFALCQEALANEGNYYTLYQQVMEDGMLVPILFRSYAVYGQRGLLDGLMPAREQIFFYTLGKDPEEIRTQE